KKKLTSLQFKRSEFAVSVAVLYRITINPKEILLVENLSKEQTLNTFVLINYWLKNATNNIYKIYLELESLKGTIKQLNQAKQKLINLNGQLANNQKLLKKLTYNNNISQN